MSFFVDKLIVQQGLIERCFTSISTLFQLYHSHSLLLMYVLRFKITSWSSKLVKDTPQKKKKKTEDAVQLEPGASLLQVVHFTTEPRKTLNTAAESPEQDQTARITQVEILVHTIPKINPW